jgi:hypothetical protein
MGLGVRILCLFTLWYTQLPTSAGARLDRKLDHGAEFAGQCASNCSGRQIDEKCHCPGTGSQWAKYEPLRRQASSRTTMPHSFGFGTELALATGEIQRHDFRNSKRFYADSFGDVHGIGFPSAEPAKSAAFVDAAGCRAGESDLSQPPVLCRRTISFSKFTLVSKLVVAREQVTRALFSLGFRASRAVYL